MYERNRRKGQMMPRAASFVIIYLLVLMLAHIVSGVFDVRTIMKAKMHK